MEREIIKVYADTIDPDHAPTLWEPTYEDVLDHGFIGLIDFMGSDSSVVNAARCSYGKGTKATRSDEGLIRYLMRHWHTSPSEMCEFTFHVKAPIFVFRQWQRHRTSSLNEYSGRYSILDNEMYVPHHSKTAPQAVNNKQGRESDLLLADDYNAVKTALDHVYEDSYQTYKYLCGPDAEGNQAKAPDAINERRLNIEEAALAAIRKSREEQLNKPEEERYVITEDEIEIILRDWFIQSNTHVITKDYPGIARELARIVLPVATYSQMYWKVNMHNLFHFLRLRADPHAQYEIRVYAEKIIEMIRPLVPMSVRAFEDYRMNGANLSRMEVELLQQVRKNNIDITNDDDVRQYLIKEQGCSEREVREFLERY